ncbi:hypothetical protein KIW84_057172 [Lathyrus oleraceus]|uniref:Integrase zinc-binding domain-containing protein n=1 Tax=Pisum sativum TaxID=3888 RepID=A0A9D4X2F9_PEA|nr:hypothetical protein KIW84_057172 [Pisum sativum]
MPPRQERPPDDISAQLREMQQSIDSVTNQQEQFQTFLTTQLPLLIKEHVASSSPQNNILTSSSTPPPPMKTPKIRLSSFDGTNPSEWIFQVESYFLLTATSPAQRLIIIPFFLQGPALVWFKWLHSNNFLTTWDAFIIALETCFGSSSYDNHEASLYKLKQTDPIGVALLQKFQATIDPASKFSVQNGLVYYQGRLFIPAECDLREKLLTEFHSSPIGVHSGGRATLARLTTSFSWPLMAQE